MTVLHSWANARLWIGSILVMLGSLALQGQKAYAQPVVVETLHVGGQYATDNPGGTDPGEEWTTAYLYLQDALVS